MKIISSKKNGQVRRIGFNKYRIHLFIGIVCVVVLLVTLTFNLNHNKYSLEKSDVLNNEIPGVVGVYLQSDGEYIKSDIIPTSGYVLNENKSYCRVNGEEDTNISINYDASNKTLSVIPMTTSGTKCYLYFDETLNGAILADNPTIDNSRNGEITGPLTENTTGTLFTAEDDYGISYVYAGDVDNNWVSFAGFYWRIIRINGDGSIRMIYSGDSESGPVETGEGTQIGTSAFNEHDNDNAYVGYMYGTPGSDTYEETHANINDSTIKAALDVWYQQNLLRYTSYISTQAGFCNDRSINTTEEMWWEYDTKLGYGTNATAYVLWSRFADTNGLWPSNQMPILKFSQTNDYFTVVGSSRGNQTLNYPIGLITADEVTLAGGFGGTDNSNYYLYTNQYYWTISPYRFNGDIGSVFFVLSNGGPGHGKNNYTYGIRPVINLDRNVAISGGNGTINNPYKI